MSSLVPTPQPRDLCVVDRILIVKGRVDHKEGETKLIAQEIQRSSRSPKSARSGSRSTPPAPRAGTIGDLKTIVNDFPGESLVEVACATSQGPQVLAFGTGYKVEPPPDFFAEVRALLGESALA